MHNITSGNHYDDLLITKSEEILSSYFSIRTWSRETIAENDFLIIMIDKELKNHGRIFEYETQMKTGNFAVTFSTSWLMRYEYELTGSIDIYKNT